MNIWLCGCLVGGLTRFLVSWGCPRGRMSVLDKFPGGGARGRLRAGINVLGSVLIPG